MEFELTDVSSSSKDSYKSKLETIAQMLYTLTKENQGIERRLKTFEQLDQGDRVRMRESLKKNSQFSLRLQEIFQDFEDAYLKSQAPVKKARTPYENSFQAFRKECKKLETLTAQTLVKEKEVLEKYRQAQEFRAITAPGLESKGLLADDGQAETFRANLQDSQEFLKEFVIRQQENIEVERSEKIEEVCNSLENVSGGLSVDQDDV